MGPTPISVMSFFSKKSLSLMTAGASGRHRIPRLPVESGYENLPRSENITTYRGQRCRHGKRRAKMGQLLSEIVDEKGYL